MKTSGIYCIRNIKSRRVYVGSSVSVEQRWRSHRHLLRQGKHHSVKLQRSWNKHGEENFIFEILEVVEQAMLLIREQYWSHSSNRSTDKLVGYLMKR